MAYSIDKKFVIAVSSSALFNLIEADGIFEDDETDTELRLGFDFDGVIADDTSETFYKNNNSDMNSYFKHESQLASSPLSEGPIGNLLQKNSFFQKLEKKKAEEDSNYKRI